MIEAGHEDTCVASCDLVQRVAGILKRQIHVFEDQSLLWVQRQCFSFRDGEERRIKIGRILGEKMGSWFRSTGRHNKNERSTRTKDSMSTAMLRIWMIMAGSEAIFWKRRVSIPSVHKELPELFRTCAVLRESSGKSHNGNRVSLYCALHTVCVHRRMWICTIQASFRNARSDQAKKERQWPLAWDCGLL